VRVCVCAYVEGDTRILLTHTYCVCACVCVCLCRVICQCHTRGVLCVYVEGSPDPSVFLIDLLSDGDSVYSSENSFESLGTPVETSLTCMGPVKMCWSNT